MTAAPTNQQSTRLQAQTKPQTKPRFPCVIFDLDGTLLDTLPGMLAAIDSLLLRHGFPAADAAQLKDSLHFGLGAMLERALPAGSMSAADVVQLQAELQRSYLQSAPVSVRPFAGTQALLQALHDAGVWLAVCSNQAESSVRQLLRSFSLDAYFKEALGGDSLARRKPDPLPLRWLAARAGVGMDSVLMVGDSEVDRASASAAGCEVVLMAHGYGLGELSEACAVSGDFAALTDDLLPPLHPSRDST